MSKYKRVVKEQAQAPTDVVHEDDEPTETVVLDEEGEEQETGEDEADEVSAPVAELVAAALDGNALKVQETFNLLVVDRIQTLIEERKPLIADRLLNPEEVEEETDEDDEDTVEEDEDNEDEDTVEEGCDTDDKGHKYDKDEVNKSIASSNRSGRKIGGKEAKMIHAVLKGRGK